VDARGDHRLLLLEGLDLPFGEIHVLPQSLGFIFGFLEFDQFLLHLVDLAVGMERVHRVEDVEEVSQSPMVIVQVEAGLRKRKSSH